VPLKYKSDILPMAQRVRRVSRDGEETTAVESTTQGFTERNMEYYAI